MAEQDRRRAAVTVKMARRVIGHLATAEVRASMAEELIAQTFIEGPTTAPSCVRPGRGPRAALTGS